MPDKLSEEKQERLFEMLDDGATRGDIADELDISERTVSNYKDDYRERREIAENVTQDSGTHRSDVLDAAEKVPGLGNQTREALENALEMNKWALEDPNELYKLINQVTDLKHYWIDTLVKNAFPELAGGNSGGRGQQQGASPQYAMGGGGGQQQAAPGGSPYPNYQGQQGGQQPQQGGQPQQYGGQPQQPQQPQQRGGGQQSGGSDRVDALEEKIDQLGGMVAELAEDGQQDDQSGRMVEIQQDDGTVIRAPADDPRVQDALGNDGMDQMMQFFQMAEKMGMLDSGNDDGGDDFLDQVQKMKEAGIINDNEDEVMEAVSEQINQGMEAMTQSQQQIMGNMQQTLQQIAEVSQSDEDDELTREEVEELLREKQEKEEIAELKERLEQQREEFKRALQKSQSSDIDPETLKTEKGYALREKQIDTMSNTMKEAPEVVGETVQNSVLPILQMLKPENGSLADAFYQHPDDQNAPINYNPNAEGQQAGRQRQSQAQQRTQQRNEQTQQAQQSSKDAAAARNRPSPPPEESTQSEDESENEAYGAKVADKLLDDGSETTEESTA